MRDRRRREGKDIRRTRLLSVGGTSDKVPTLTQMLRLVAGRVPLIIELKGERVTTRALPPQCSTRWKAMRVTSR